LKFDIDRTDTILRNDEKKSFESQLQY